MTKGRKSAIILLLLALGCTAAWAEAPQEARGFAGDGLHLYPLGWSSEGRWGALVGRDDSGTGPNIRILVMDAVTDEILLLSDPLPWSGEGSFGVFWDLFAPRVEEIVSSYNLETTRRPDVRDPVFTTGGVSYEFVMNPPSPADGRYTLRITSSRGDSKEVYSGPAADPPDRSYLLGALVSPFEERALAVIRELPTFKTGSASYRFSGAHLTLGFTSSAQSRVFSGNGGVLTAVFNGQESLVRSRLASGADAEETDTRGYPALLVAARLDHWDIVGLLLDAGVSPNPVDSDGRSALHLAAFVGEEEAVRRLLAAGADKNRVDLAGLKPADLAADPAVRGLLR
ncbi:MAG: ankyrin repeat domain-containing protein [Spirochaetaceae bacterium]|nr:ankyrin repeat domain-containing protein [Spirochaetaceae bacterium]